MFTDGDGIVDLTTGNGASGLLTSTMRDHCVVLLFENMPEDSSFELTITRHFEGTPDDTGSVLERKEATLTSFSTPLELISRMDSDAIMTGTNGFKLSMAPFLAKAKDILQYGLDKIRSSPKASEVLEGVLPDLLQSAFMSIPYLAPAAPLIQQVTKQILKEFLQERV